MTRLALLLLPLLLLAACGGPEEDAPAPPLEQAETWEGYGTQTVVLFFAEGSLEPTWREELRVIELADDPVERIDHALAELLRGPEQGFGRAFPPGVTIAHVFLEEREGLLTLDLEPAGSVAIERAGSLEERIALEALRRCLRVNFPSVRGLRLLIGGERAETLGGHLNISRPLSISLGDGSLN